jgi:hypothetical protein
VRYDDESYDSSYKSRETLCILLGRGLIVTALSFALTPVVGAQAWPTKPIRMIVNFAAGGSTDVIARSMSSKLSETLGQQVVVDNRVASAVRLPVLRAKSSRA